MLTLFDAPILPGLSARSEFLTASEEADLIARIEATDLTPFSFQQWTGKRLTHSFGWTYDFQSGAVDQAERLPDWLLPIRDRAAAFAGLDAQQLVQALLLKYDTGAGIGWHRDRPVYEHVIGVSLGAPAEMRFRQKEGARYRRAVAALEPRGAYHLSGEARHNWEHSIVEMGADPRYSITFRSFSAAGLRLVRSLGVRSGPAQAA